MGVERPEISGPRVQQRLAGFTLISGVSRLCLFWRHGPKARRSVGPTRDLASHGCGFLFDAVECRGKTGEDRVGRCQERSAGKILESGSLLPTGYCSTGDTDLHNDTLGHSSAKNESSWTFASYSMLQLACHS